MPDRRYTYTVEIDAAQARTAAQQLRQLFERELAQIMTKPGSGPTVDQTMQRTQQTAETARRTLEQIGKIDLTAGADELNRQLTQTQERIRQLRNEYERMLQTAEARQGTSARQRANLETYFGEVGRFAGDDAEAQARLLGRALNVGQMGAEFKQDDAGLYGEAVSNKYKMQVDTDQKRRHTLAEQQELARLESEMYARELDAVRLEKETTARRLRELEGNMDALFAAASAGDKGAEAQIDRVSAEIADVDRSMADLVEQEADLLNTVERANKRAAETAEAAARTMARQQATSTGQILAASPGAPGAYTSQTALTVSTRSVENAEKLAAAMREAAEATERQARALQNADRRGWELDTLKQRATIEQAARINAEKEIAATKAAQAQQTAITQAEGRTRVELAKGEARAVAEAAEAATAQIKGEENRRTAILKAELKERERAAAAAARQQTAASRGAGGGLPGGMSLTGLAYGAAGALGIYGIDQVARGTYQAGYEGAQQMRQMETFEALAQRVGVSSAVVVRAIREASRETITGTNAMGLAAQVLSQRFAATSDDIAGDIETLVRFSRRASQIYTDESGQFLTTQDVFARLIKFAREGNKELVDQFGLSNKAIADALGTTVDGLASATGAADRWKGMLLLLDEEMNRLGESSASTADKFEADTARIEEAWNRIKRSLADPVAAVVTYAADTVEAAQVRTSTADTEVIRGTFEKSLATYKDIGKDAPQGFEEITQALTRLDEATAKNAAAAKFYAAELRTLAQDAYNMGFATKEQTQRAVELERALELIAGGQDAWGYAMQATNKKSIESNSTLFQIAIRMGELENAYVNGSITMEQYTRTMDAFSASMRGVAGAAGLVVREIGAVNEQIGTANAAMKAFFDAAPRTPSREGEQGIPIFPGAIAGQANAAGPSAFNLQQQQNQYDMERIDAQTQRDATARAEKKRAEEQAARQTASAFESAAKKAQSAFEAAARDSANEFKAALEKVPGLLGTSEVTAEDMALAAVGGYQEKADERLRRLADEVLNRTDTPEDPADWARRLGLDPGTDPRRVLAEAQARWADSSLFAGGANLDLINRDAITASLARQDASKAGRDALLKEFGLGESSPLDEAGKGALSEMLGLGEQELTAAGGEARAAFDAGFYAPAAQAAAGAGETAGMAQAITQQLKTDIETGEVADALYSIGSGIFGKIHAGFEAAAEHANWSDVLIDSIATDVAPLVAEMLADQLPPKP